MGKDEVLPEQNKQRRFIIVGFEHENLWKPAELFIGENEHEILLTTDNFSEAQNFESLELAEYKIEYLQANYSDYSWHVLVSKL